MTSAKWIYAVMLLLAATGGLTLILGFAVGSEDGYPKAERGVIDLTRWDPAQGGPVMLNGEWAYERSAGMPPDGAAASGAAQPSSAHGYIVVDGGRSGQGIAREPHSAYGYAVYRLQIRLGEMDEPLALRVSGICASYRLKVNGKTAAAVGELDAASAHEQPGCRDKLAAAYTDASGLNIELAVAHADQAGRAPRVAVLLGSLDDMLRRQSLAAGFDTLLIGSLVMMGLYHAGLFAVRRKDPALLCFGLFCLVTAFRLSLLGEGILFGLFPELEWLTVAKAEYATAIAGIPLFVLFLGHLYP